MRLHNLVYYTGRIMLVSSLLLLLPAIMSLVYNDCGFWHFVITAAAVAVLSLLMSIKKPESKGLYAKEGFAVVAFIWVALSAAGAIPFVTSGSIPSFTDAFFETVSGFTTTGASILTDIESLPKSMLFWRSFTHWVGGMGVLALAIAIMPGQSNSGSGSGGDVHVLKAEMPGPTFGKIVSKLRGGVRILYLIYFALTVFEVIFLCAGKLSLYDSLIHAFGTAGTGGFSNYGASVGAFNSAYVDVVITVFMLLFGVNFNVYFFMLVNKFRTAFKCEEIRWYFGFVAVSIGIITANIYHLYGNIAAALRYSSFQVASIITTTGYATADFDKWPVLSKVILVLLMFIGACASSTGGGLKVSRVVILLKVAVRDIRRAFNPREVKSIRIDGTYVENSVVSSVVGYFVIYMILFALSVILIAPGADTFETAFTAVAACLNNIGPGLGAVGATGNYSAFSPFQKYVLSFNMLAGRLELFPMLIMFARANTYRAKRPITIVS